MEALMYKPLSVAVVEGNFDLKWNLDISPFFMLRLC